MKWPYQILFVAVLLFSFGLDLYENALATRSWSSDSATVTQTSSQQPSLTTVVRPGRFAYAFVISGCTESSCLGYILNVLVAARILQDKQSVADVVLHVQMSTATININTNTSRTSSAPAARLHVEMEQWLQAAGVILLYSSNDDTPHNFGLATLQKFRVLDMTDYDRVLFLDADILLLCHLDYMFHESYHHTTTGHQQNPNKNVLLQANVAVAGAVAPAAGSMFLVTPEVGEYQRIMNVVQQRTTNVTKFDPITGWGHAIQPPDHWEAWGLQTKKTNNTKWNFYGASADQGLLYHWFRYMKLNYTHIHADRIETWRDVTSGTGSTEQTTGVRHHVHKVKWDDGSTKLVAMVKERPIRDLQACGDLRNSRGDARTSVAPWLDHFHFAGRKKPWNQKIRSQDIPGHLPRVGKGPLWARDTWLYQLGRANESFALELPSVIVASKGNPLGYKPTDQDLFLPRSQLPNV
jgi:hypothetical protein